MKNPLVFDGCTDLVTPFLNGEVNFIMLERLLKRQIEAGIRAVIIAGPTSESPALSEEEKIAMVHRAKEYAGRDCRIIAGADTHSSAHPLSYDPAAPGCVGAFSVLANVWPERVVAMTAAAEKGDFQAVGQMQAELMPMINLLFSDINPIPVKKALQLMGYDVGPCRPPLGESDPALTRRLAARLM